MKTIDELRAAYEAAASNLKALHDAAKNEGRELTDEEQDRETGLLNEQEDLLTRIEHRQRAQQLQDRAAKVSAPQTHQPQAIATPRAQPRERVEVRQRHGRLKAFTWTDGARDAYVAGRQFLASVYNHRPSREWCEQQGIDLRAAQSHESDAGGTLVPDQMERAVIDNREEYGVARRYCQIMPMASDTLTVPRIQTSPTVYFVGENSAVTESEATFDAVDLTARKLAALTRMSTEIAEDAIVSMADMLADRIAYVLAEKEDDCLFNGDGSSTYGGITGIAETFTNNNSLAGAVDPQANHDAFDEVDADDLTALMAELPAWATDPKWFCSRQCLGLTFQALLAAAGGNTKTDLSGRLMPSYLGFDVIVSQKMPTSTSTHNNSTMLLYGDMRRSVMLGDRRGLTVKRLDERYAEYDQIGLVVTERFDINFHEPGDTSDAGGMVALVGKTS